MQYFLVSPPWKTRPGPQLRPGYCCPVRFLWSITFLLRYLDVITCRDRNLSLLIKEKITCQLIRETKLINYSFSYAFNDLPQENGVYEYIISSFVVMWSWVTSQEGQKIYYFLQNIHVGLDMVLVTKRNNIYAK